MATRLPNYQMRDGRTRLGQSYFNPIWADLDSRLDTLERIKLDWNAQVAQLRDLGLQRIDEYIRPVVEEVDALLAQATEETNGLAATLVDEHITPLVTQVNQILQQAQQDADAIAQALADMNWEQQLQDLEDSFNNHTHDGRYYRKTELDASISTARYDLASAATTATLDLDSHQVYRVDAAVNPTLSISNPPASSRGMTVVIDIEGTGTISWPASINWSGSSAPELNAVWTEVTLLWTGTKWRGFKSGGAD